MMTDDRKRNDPYLDERTAPFTGRVGDEMLDEIREAVAGAYEGGFTDGQEEPRPDGGDRKLVGRVEAILVVTCAPPRGNYSGPVKEIVSRYVTEDGAVADMVKYEIDKPRWVAEVEVFSLLRRWRNPEIARGMRSDSN